MIPDSFLDDVALLRNLLAEGGSATHRISSSRVSVALEPAKLGGLNLIAFATRGNLVEVTVRVGHDFSAKFTADGSAVFTLARSQGELASVAEDPSAANEALSSGRFESLLAVVPASLIDLELTLRPPDDSFEFVWDDDVLTDTLRGGWAAVAQRLGSVSHLVFLNASGILARTRSPLITGPDSTQVTVERAATESLNGMTLCVPGHFLPVVDLVEGPITTALNKLAVGVAWLRLASSVRTVGPNAAITLPGVPQLDIEVGWDDLPASETDAQAAVGLIDWICEADSALRTEAAQQASAPTIRTPRDLDASTATVFRQARFLYELTRRNLVAAAVDARNAARTAARSAANDAAKEARSAARSTSDRTVAAVIASIAVVISHKAEALNQSVSVLVLAAVAVGLVAAALHAFSFEFPRTRSALAATLDELEHAQREALTKVDVEEVRNGPVVADAHETIAKARSVASVALTTGFASAVLAIGVVLGTSADAQKVQSEPSATTVPAPPTSVGSAVPPPTAPISTP